MICQRNSGSHKHNQTTPQHHPCLCILAPSTEDNFGTTYSVKQNARIFCNARKRARQRPFVDTSPCPLSVTLANNDIRHTRALTESVAMTGLWKRSRVANIELWTPMSPRSLARTHTHTHTHTHAPKHTHAHEHPTRAHAVNKNSTTI
jgi:hypothetical protein